MTTYKAMYLGDGWEWRCGHTHRTPIAARKCGDNHDWHDCHVVNSIGEVIPIEWNGKTYVVRADRPLTPLQREVQWHETMTIFRANARRTVAGGQS